MGKVTVPFIGMIIAECVQVALIILSKQVMSQGMTSFIFIFYSNSIAALVLLLSSFFIHRFQLPPITFSTLSAFFILGLLGQVHSFIHSSFFLCLFTMLIANNNKYHYVYFQLFCAGFWICWD
jgi:hypothetical protein